MGYALQRALNDIAGTTGMAVEGAANLGVTRVARTESSAPYGFYVKPTGVVRETLPRSTTNLSNGAVLTSGTIHMMAVPMLAGEVCTTATFVSGATALATGTNQWFGLFDSARVALRFTNNDGATAWAANTAKTLTFATAYTIPTNGLYYLGIMVAATTVPTLQASVNGDAAVNGVAPIVCGNSSAAQTTVPVIPFTAAAITATATRPYAYIS